MRTDPIKVYKLISERGINYPQKYWEGELGRDRAIAIFRYVYFDLLRYTLPEQIVLLDTVALKKYNLMPPYKIAFGGRKENVISALFPDLSDKVAGLRLKGLDKKSKAYIKEVKGDAIDYKIGRDADFIDRIRARYQEGASLRQLECEFGYSREWIRWQLQDLPSNNMKTNLIPQLCEDYDDNVSVSELSEKYKVTESAIERALRAHIRRKQLTSSQVTREEIVVKIRELYANGMRSEDIADSLGVAVSTVWPHTRDLRPHREVTDNDILLAVRNDYRKGLSPATIAVSRGVSTSTVNGYTIDLRAESGTLPSKALKTFETVRELYELGKLPYEIKETINISLTQISRIVKCLRLRAIEREREREREDV